MLVKEQLRDIRTKRQIGDSKKERERERESKTRKGKFSKENKNEERDGFLIARNYEGVIGARARVYEINNSR